jgi:hypothetical protein
MTAELKASVLAAAAAEPSPTRDAVRQRNVLWGVLAAASGVAAFVVFALLTSDGHLLRFGTAVGPDRHLERSIWEVLATAGGALAIATTALWVSLRRGSSMLGRSSTWLLGAIAVIPLALFGWKVACSVAFADPMAEWLQRAGLRCLALSLLVAAGPLLAFLAIRRIAPAHPALNGAAIGVTAGACAWVGVDLWCPIAFVPHLLLGHVLPLGILAGAGALLGRALLGLQGRRHR